MVETAFFCVYNRLPSIVTLTVTVSELSLVPERVSKCAQPLRGGFPIPRPLGEVAYSNLHDDVLDQAHGAVLGSSDLDPPTPLLIVALWTLRGGSWRRC